MDQYMRIKKKTWKLIMINLKYFNLCFLTQHAKQFQK